MMVFKYETADYLFQGVQIPRKEKRASSRTFHEEVGREEAWAGEIQGEMKVKKTKTRQPQGQSEASAWRRERPWLEAAGGPEGSVHQFPPATQGSLEQSGGMNSTPRWSEEAMTSYAPWLQLPSLHPSWDPCFPPEQRNRNWISPPTFNNENNRLKR
ncbi:uncharacterized protein LOC117092313 [Trachypithecus francoisi]|uniref:uncharacterized protein LOC117092313 n=1 Tax=Trachypithecus francoisi TaxID=54180 RepID=UPI00141B7AA6|nr:uncharacterized protein LOC117092313 [Trachypithecus francoisi]